MPHNVVLNRLYEERRNQSRALEKAQKSGNQIGAKRAKNEIARIDGEIANLK